MKFHANVLIRSVVVSAVVSVAVAAPLHVAAPSAAAKTSQQVLNLTYSRDSGSVPPESRRDIELTVRGSVMTFTVKSDRVLVNKKVTLSKAVVDQTITSLKATKNVSFTGNMCPGAKRSVLSAKVRKRSVKRTAVSCGPAESDREAFYETEALVEPLIAVLGDLDELN
jgi:hypothetical protein